ncbi:hypothetical protein SLS58_005154 [Diplodia intermedia]|uniref:Xylanolytic transcriptional activator regulatory domain-containing protein n=1 Tax=Diplodia intermedia TaxID=856260 RepID=A0ABR3TRI8_9PEZI
MGRLVLNDQQVPMFAGSSTGVHFISQAEQKLQMLNIHPESLPSGVYSLYLNSLSNAPPPAPSPHLAASYIAQFPPDAEQIIARAIDRWTPLYPIVHKPSTLAAFRSLLRNPAADNDGDQLCTIHQTLLLLALGTINTPCSNPQHAHHHHHPLCLSDAYYAAASTAGALAARLPGSSSSSLPALQALVLAQLYLQLSSRHPAASHLGGAAVRLAQTLGLHRHSARFKLFDPAAAELRRRAWWCVYALDAFAAAWHGLPRLVRDRDVDADMATRVEWGGEGQEMHYFPLPGERSAVDPAIALFRLAAVVGDALELLYTTTRRRGGAPAKIARLQADLDVWEQRCLAPLLLSHRSSSSSSPPPRPSAGLGGGGGEPHPSAAAATPRSTSRTGFSPLPTTFLRAALCNATVLVHRPALAFTAPHPQFAASLLACGRASVALIRLLDEEASTSSSVDIGNGNDDDGMAAAAAAAVQVDDDERRQSAVTAVLLYPNGLHMLWQAGLTVLFARWNGVGVVDGGDGDVDGGGGGDEGAVVRCAEVLRRLAGASCGGGGGDGEESVRRCADVLDMLRVRTFGDRAREREKAAAAAAPETRPRSLLEELLPAEQLQWNVWDWPMASALELANTLDAMPLDLDFEGGDPSW